MIKLTDFVNIIFTDRGSYKNVTEKEKEDFFFFVNKQLGRALPEHTENFNHRNVNKASAMDTWVLFIEQLQNSGDRSWPKNRVPYWFWGKKAEAKEIKTPDQVILDLIASKRVQS